MTARIATRRSQARGRNHTLMRLRVNAGLSPNELGAEAKVSGKTIRDAEEGKIVPLPRTQFQIAEALGKRPTDIWPIGGSSSGD